ncbi:hypothetical protein P170DRAFT_365144 [Aspergillus steynii IBT 23096]|uniref:Uncharacterized protein n=1 Tax=Aspergillus steynii IBT 23096 TaxID=1392250 RepID=A0A2I2FZI8_9EURO|nr:uncharacterized protein P170DRAFT_365144 [Aspergillus steynii IBT 23096]PLB46045.1 hypothetical protein P170DRAFT_365144 [Aspergillus steynii IBT 23096]
MSNALPYLQKLRKSQLVDWAEATDLKDYEDLNKPELVTTLDDHLQSNQSIFATDDRLAEYYRRLSQSPRLSPTKREPKLESPTKVSPTKLEAPRSVRRGRKAKEEIEQTDDSDVSPQAIATTTPGRSPLVTVQPPLPPSPAVVTDAIDRQTAAWGERIGDAWTALGVRERSHALRSILSSAKAVEILFVALEGAGLFRTLLPLAYVATVPAVEAINSPEIPISVPDLFKLVEGTFWAPLSLWLLTSLFLPLTAAYFFNLSGQTSGGPALNTRRNRAAQATFDPLSFNIAKALISYLVYANRFTFWNVFSDASIATVNESVPGQWAGILTGSAIGTIGTLYEAILKK